MKLYRLGMFMGVFRWVLIAVMFPLGSLHAQSRWGSMGGIRILSEILMSGGESRSTSSGRTAAAASDARQKAAQALHRVDTPEPVSATVILVEGDAPPDNRKKAKEYSQGELAIGERVLVVPRIGNESEPASAKNGVSRNLARARKYMQGQDNEPTNTGKFFQSGTTVGVLGKDGVIEMVCDGVNNNVGRIGDDTHSGSVFTIMVAGKPVTARCK